jgi:hypothetical protein
MLTYLVGDVWTYSGDDHDNNSVVLINKIEKGLNQQKILHISVLNINFANGLI